MIDDTTKIRISWTVDDSHPDVRALMKVIERERKEAAARIADLEAAVATRDRLLEIKDRNLSDPWSVSNGRRYVDRIMASRLPEVDRVCPKCACAFVSAEGQDCPFCRNPHVLGYTHPERRENVDDPT
jgi:hypothetical protein